MTTPLDRATMDALFADIADLRTRAEAQATKDCVTGIGVAALSGVLAAGVLLFTGIPAAIASSAVAGMTIGMGGEIVAILATYVGIQGGIAAVVGTASGAAVAAATDVVGSCRDARNGVGGATPAP